MATRRSGRSANAASARASPRATDMSMALRAWGLEIVTIHSGPSATAVTEDEDGVVIDGVKEASKVLR